MKLGVDITPEFSVELDVPPGALAPSGVQLDWKASTEDELEHLVGLLGFDAAEMDPTESLHCRYGLPVTRDGEEVARGTVNLWVERLPAARPPIPALSRLVEAGKAAKREAARQRANADAVAWAQDAGREVELRDGEVVERG